MIYNLVLLVTFHDCLNFRGSESVVCVFIKLEKIFLRPLEVDFDLSQPNFVFFP